MAEFASSIIEVFTGLFGGMIEALGTLGNLFFETSEAGAVTVSGFGWLVAVLIGVPLATWLFSKIFTAIMSLGRRGR